jgi:non-ribosomal peptide synthetase-like protein
MDEEGHILPQGQTGELVIGGVGVTKGYLNRDDLTKQKFITNTYTALSGDRSPVLFRTGDRARINEEGNIEYLGRIDTQVKIRGYRVELSEIETLLMSLPEVKNAAVVAREVDGNIRLGAFVIPKKGKEFSEGAALAELKKKLPPYMIPSYIEAIKKFPMLPNGKIDRNGLPEMKLPTHAEPHQHFSSPVKDFIYRAWVDIFGDPDITDNDNFFTDLGGHSLLAAQFVSQLRKDGRWTDISMRDLYDNPTLALLAAHLETRHPIATAAPAVFHRISRWRYLLGGFVQAIGLYFNIGFFSLQWVSPFLTYGYMRAYEYSMIESLIAAFLALALVYPAMLIIGVLLKWIVLGRVKEGDHPLWGFYYLRWLFVQNVLANIPLDFLSGTPIIGFYLRLLGSRIGRDVYIDSDLVSGLDVLSIGDGTSINAEANISCHCMEDGLLKIRRVTIGNNVSIGSQSAVSMNTVIADNAVVDDLTCIASGMRVEANERWHGSPAVRHKEPVPARKEREATPFFDVFSYIFYGSSFFVLPTLGLLPIFPGIMLMYHFDLKTESYYYLLVAPVVAVIFVVLSAVQIVVLKWLFLGRLKEGIYPIKSIFYMRKWVVDKLMDISLDMLGTLYATLYLRPWYHALGVKLGQRAEVSTASFILPDLLTIGAFSFIADAVGLGAAKIDGENIVIKPTVIGTRSFIGNGALIPVGSEIGNDCLIGCQSIPPSEKTPDGTSWVGSPAVFLPKRERRDVYFAKETTYNPTHQLYIKRLIIEFFRVILPSTAFIIFTTLLLSFFILLEDEVELWEALLFFPLIYIGLGVMAIFVTALMKSLIVGKYKPDEKPLWSTFVWKTELLTGFIDYFLNMFFVEHLQGTVFFPWYLRLMGMKIGKRACLHTWDFTEFDLVSLGDDVSLNEECTIQTHLFEDRVMKLGTINIGSRVSVGSFTLVLYNTTIEDDVKVGDLSLVMKGETLPKNTRWAGSPVKPDWIPPV